MTAPNHQTKLQESDPETKLQELDSNMELQELESKMKLGELDRKRRRGLYLAALLVVVALASFMIAKLVLSDGSRSKESKTSAANSDVQTQSQQSTLTPNTVSSPSAPECAGSIIKEVVGPHSYCGPATARIKLGTRDISISGGICSRGEGWFLANLGVYVTPDNTEISDPNSFITISAGVFPPEDDPRPTTTMPLPQSASDPAALRFTDSSTTSFVTPLFSDGVYEGPKTIVVRSAERQVALKDISITLSDNRSKVVFSGAAIDNGDPVSGDLTCI